MAIQQWQFKTMVKKVELLHYLEDSFRLWPDPQINRGRVETQPRCKIQYPMKNRGEDAYKKS